MNVSKTLTYNEAGDYRIPNLVLSEPPRELTEPLGTYGRTRKTFLKEHRPISYNSMLLGETLFPHLREIESEAISRMEHMMEALTANATLPDKSSDPMGWTAAMNSLKAQAEELVLHELIYS